MIYTLKYSVQVNYPLEFRSHAVILCQSTTDVCRYRSATP